MAHRYHYPPPTNDYDHYSAGDFWYKITGQTDYNPQSAKASQISNPVLRLAHRILVYSIFFKSDLGGVSQDELFFLWALTYGRYSIPIDPASWLASRFVKILTQRGRAAVIHCGGMITHIAINLGLSLDTLRPVEGSCLLDLHALTTAQLISQHPSMPARYWCLVRGRRTVLLPNEEKITLRDPTNFILEPDADVGEAPGAEEDNEGAADTVPARGHAAASTSAPHTDQYSSGLPPHFPEEFERLRRMTEDMYRRQLDPSYQLPPFPPRPWADD